MSLIRRIVLGLFAVSLPLQADALTIRFEDLLNPGNTLTVNDDDALDTGDPNSYLGRDYHSRIFMAPFSFGGFDFSQMVGQGDEYSWIGDNESGVLDLWRDQLGAMLSLAGTGHIQIAITDLLENISLRRFGSRHELDTTTIHSRDQATTLDLSVATYRGGSAFDTAELLLDSGPNDYRYRGGGNPFWNGTFLQDRPASEFGSYWATHVITIEGNGSIEARVRLSANVSQVPLPLSAAALFGAIGLLGGLRLSRRGT